MFLRRNENSRVPLKASLSLVLFSALVGNPAHALRTPTMGGDDTGAAAVYTFDEVGGDVAHDTSGSGAPLDLKMSVDGNLPSADGTTIRTNAILQNGYLLINPKPNGSEVKMPDQGYQSAQRHRTFLISDVAATKLSQCTKGFTIQVFVRSWFPFQGSNNGNMIVGLSNSDGLTSVAAPNFGLYQNGQSGSEGAMMSVRTNTNAASSQSSVSGAFYSVRETENPGKLTELIATQEPNGTLTVYVNRIARSSLTVATPMFSAAAKLVVGNELVPLSLNKDMTVNVDQQKNWSGEIHHMAIYCRGFSRQEILGDLIASKSRADIVKPLARTQIAASKVDARRLIERLTGVIIPIDHPMVAKVEARLAQGDRVGAAKIVTGDATTNEPGHPEFLNTVVKQLAMKMSNREETIRAPLNDFAASFIGVARDERNAQELLTEDFFYMANPAKAKVRTDIFRDLIVSNNHYEDLEQGQWDVGKVLMRVPGPEVPTGYPTGQQIAIDANGAMKPNPEPAGVITSRAFMGSHSIAGTNRRLVEYSFREFMCVPMSEAADTSASPARIGRDVDRLPGGDSTKFETSCKGCHTIMDGFRGAFAFFDFANVTVNGANFGFIRHAQVSKPGDFGFPDKTLDKNGVVLKMNHNETVFPNGYEITDNSFVNNAVGAANKPKFGWGGSNARGGTGVNQFGHMIAESTRFSQCMAKRVYETVCLPGGKGDARVTPLIEDFANQFKASGYKLRSLFQIVAAHPNCAANMGR
jgi:hypothetical protein